MLALWLMTALGQSRHSDYAQITSGLSLKADIARESWHVSKVPNSEVNTPISIISVGARASGGEMWSGQSAKD